MIKISNIKLDIDKDINDLKEKAAGHLRISVGEITDFVIVRRSIDARRGRVCFVYSVAATLKSEGAENALLKRNKDKSVSKYNPDIYEIPIPQNKPDKRPVIVGCGPAGLFCAYALAIRGFKPIIIERGKDVDSRTEKVSEFWNGGALDTNCNVSFGEGGAGTFSDGKLNTSIKDKGGRGRFVLDTFVKYGASDEIIYDAKPHIGTDVLKDILKNMREEIISLGGEYLFNTRLDAIMMENSSIKSIRVCDIENNRERIMEAETLVLAIGHSARDTYEMLLNNDVSMKPKAFAVGFRVEHPQEMIDDSQYSHVKDEQTHISGDERTKCLFVLYVSGWICCKRFIRGRSNCRKRNELLKA